MEIQATPSSKPSNKLENAIHISGALDAGQVKRGIYLVLLHANRVPPHIGMMIDHTYHSLSIKGREVNVSGDALLKNISLRKIPAVFVEIEKHPVFSDSHLSESFAEQVMSFDKVNTEGNTCLSPVRLFFEEFYAIDKRKISLVFDLLRELAENQYSRNAFGAHLGALKENIFYLQPYNRRDLEKQIEEELAKLKK